MVKETFINFTQLDEKEALKKINEFRDIVKRGEYERQDDIKKAKRNRDIFMNRIWDEKDLAFFESLNATPYQFAVQRPLINNLITRQRNRRFSFDVVPTDIHAYKRQRAGRDEFVAEHLEDFDSVEQAEEYYDKYADDEYARAVSAMLQNVRNESKAKFTESEVFENGLVTGLDFFKCIYSRRFNREGGIEITRKPQNAIIYDRSTVSYYLKDISYIGEVHLLYKENLVSTYPEFAELIEEYFKNYSTLNNRELAIRAKDWQFFYNFETPVSDDKRLPIAELWTLQNEERFKVIDLEHNEERIVQFGIDEEGIEDGLKTQVLIELHEQAQEDEAIVELLESDDIELYIEEVIQTRFQVETTTEPIWYKAVFSYNALFEYERSPLPHGSHPYSPYFSSFNEGEYRGIMEDIADIIIAINKALAFRELMMAHGAKGLVVVDHDTLIKSGYTPDDIAEQWTELGGVLVLKLKNGRRIQDVFDTVTTIGQGLAEINNVLADLDNRLYTISGVNLAQLGVTQGETPASRYRQQIAEGEANNGLLFDNFVRTLENFYNDKVVPLVVEYMKLKKKSVIRLIGDEYKPWIEIDFNEDFDLFERAVRAGEFATVLVPKEENPRINAERAARYMEFAMAGFLDPEVALEFSDDPQRYKIIKRNREAARQRAKEQAGMMVDMQMVQQMMVDEGLSVDQASEMVEKMKKERMRQIYQEEQAQRGRQAQEGQGASTIQSQASQSRQQTNQENTTME
jgi:hypothetical protein